MDPRSASHRFIGAGFVEGGLHKDPNASALYVIRQHGVECNRLQLQSEPEDEVAGSTPNTADDSTVAVPPGTKIDEEERPAGPHVEGKDGLQSSNLEKDGFGNMEPGIHIQ